MARRISVDPRQLNLQDNPPIIYELKEMEENSKNRLARVHCNIYPCRNIATFFLLTRFGKIQPLICGVCDEHARILDDFLEPVRLHNN